MSMELIEQAGVDKRKAVIDVGGGDSRLVDALVQCGYRDVTVLDVSPAALERARQRLDKATSSRVEWIADDVTLWEPSRFYDLWHDRAVFHFLTDLGARRRYLGVLRAAVRPEARVIIATFSLAGPAMCSGLDVRRYSAETLSAELGPAYRLEESREQVHTTPAGAEQAFVYGRFQLTD
jgi:cyclopropane fatty-acyl-phospholipid synthase-like methyltransferase